MASVPEEIQTAIPGHSSVPSRLISCDTWRWLAIDYFNNFYLQGRSQHNFIESHWISPVAELCSSTSPEATPSRTMIKTRVIKKGWQNNSKHFTNTCGWPLANKKKTDDDSIKRRNRRRATLERKRELEPRYDPQLFLGWLVTTPEVFAKVNSAQQRRGGWKCYQCNFNKERRQIKRIKIWIWITKFWTLHKLTASSLLSLSRAKF